MHGVHAWWCQWRSVYNVKEMSNIQLRASGAIGSAVALHVTGTGIETLLVHFFLLFGF